MLFSPRKAVVQSDIRSGLRMKKTLCDKIRVSQLLYTLYFPFLFSAVFDVYYEPIVTALWTNYFNS